MNILTYRQAFVCSAWPWHPHRRPVHHSQPRRRATPVMPIIPAVDGHHPWLWRQWGRWCTRSWVAVLTILQGALDIYRAPWLQQFAVPVSDVLFTKLQNVAVRVVTLTRMFDYITSLLRQLHWLPVQQRTAFKLAMTTFKCLHGLAPPSWLTHVFPFHPSLFRVPGTLLVGETL